jgi:hypothetical protein
MYHRHGICERDYNTLAVEIEKKLRYGELDAAYDQVKLCLTMRQDKAQQIGSINQGHAYAIKMVDDLLEKIVELGWLRRNNQINNRELDSIQVNYIDSDFKIDYINRRGFRRQVIPIRHSSRSTGYTRKRSPSPSRRSPTRRKRSLSRSPSPKRKTFKNLLKVMKK